MNKRKWVKQKLRKIGYKTKGQYFKEFKNFLNEYYLQEEPLGILFEYALSYIFGVFQSGYHERFCVTITDYLDDEEKVDFLINNHRLQIKLNWDESRIPIDVEAQYRLFGVKVLLFYSKDKKGQNTCGIDVIREILFACGFSEEIIEENIDNPAFDAAEEILSDWLFN